MKRTLIVVLSFVALLIVYGTFIEPRFILDVQEHEAEVPQLPTEWEGRKVAMLADFQVGMWMDNVGMISRAVDEAIDQDVDVVVIAGDFVYKPDSSVVDEAVALLRPLHEAGIPVLAVLGNHDYSLMKRESQIRPDIARYLSDELEREGIRVLENQTERVALDGLPPLAFVGIGSEWAEHSLPSQALATLNGNEARIVFMHNPVAYRDMPADSAPLTLAAHTHGGQIRFPFMKTNSWLDIARDREVVAEGWAASDIGAAGNRLYVTRGIGFSLVPMRLFCPPEVTVFTLRRSDGTLPARGPNA